MKERDVHIIFCINLLTLVLLLRTVLSIGSIDTFKALICTQQHMSGKLVRAVYL